MKVNIFIVRRGLYHYGRVKGGRKNIMQKSDYFSSYEFHLRPSLLGEYVIYGYIT
jgi:hypothetical protein